MSSTESKIFASFYDALCYILDTNEIDQRKFSKKYRINESMISKWLSGSQSPQKKSLRKLSNLLNCEIKEVGKGEWEVTKEEDIHPPPVISEINDEITEYESQLIDAIKHLSPEDASVELLKSYLRLTQAYLDKIESRRKDFD